MKRRHQSNQSWFGVCVGRVTWCLPLSSPPPPEGGRVSTRRRQPTDGFIWNACGHWWDWCVRTWVCTCVWEAQGHGQTYPWPWQPSLLETSRCSRPSRRSLSSAVKESGSSTFCERERKRNREGGREWWERWWTKSSFPLMCWLFKAPGPQSPI